MRGLSRAAWGLALPMARRGGGGVARREALRGGLGGECGRGRGNGRGNGGFISDGAFPRAAREGKRGKHVFHFGRGSFRQVSRGNAFWSSQVQAGPRRTPAQVVRGRGPCGGGGVQVEFFRLCAGEMFAAGLLAPAWPSAAGLGNSMASGGGGCCENAAFFDRGRRRATPGPEWGRFRPIRRAFVAVSCGKRTFWRGLRSAGAGAESSTAHPPHPPIRKRFFPSQGTGAYSSPSGKSA